MSRNTQHGLSFMWMTVAVAIAVALSASVGWAQNAGETGPAPGAAPKAGDGAPDATGDTNADSDAGTGAVKEPSAGNFKELHIRKVDIRGALEMLNSQVKKNIITTKEATGTVTADLYDVTFDEALKAITESNGLAFVKEGNLIIVMTAEQKAKRTAVVKKSSTEIFHLSYTNATDMRVLIEPYLSATGKIAITPAAQVGITASKVESGGNSLATSDVLIVTDFDDNLRRIAKAIKDLDSKPDQVLIEATLLRASLTENNALGVDFNVLSGVDFSALGTTTDGLQSATVGSETPAFAKKNRMMTFRTDYNAAVTGGGLTFGFMSDNVGVFVRALEGITDVSVMANPKLLVANKQRGEVLVGRKDGYITTTFTETTASETVEFLETGTRLVVRPYIARDDHVRLEIHPEDSGGGVALVGANALPWQTTTEVTSNVIVRDGHTIVIGGLFSETTSANRSQTPIVGNIPYVGALWRNTVDAVEREEMIILVTPRIIRNGADEAISEQLRDDVERFRLGARKGIRWWGRGRLAHAQIRYARAAMAKGNRGRAIWHVDAALSLMPTLVEAVELKERLTGKAYWADAVKESNARFIIQRMIMNDLGKPLDSVIPRNKPLDGEGLDDDVKKAFNIQPRVLEQDDRPADGAATGKVPEDTDAGPVEPDDAEAIVIADPMDDAVEEPVETPADDAGREQVKDSGNDVAGATDEDK